ncbi:MAG: phage tail assembly chaperone [Polymorphobacter sp.]|uniref:phage tail assembly chaperone n=1 Tax=Polymorphobacter sp. TaxID=1909290 RepID=UPI003A8AADBC
MTAQTFGAAARLALRLAVLELGWRPDDFWAATPQDLIDALGLGLAVGGEAAPIDGALLARMMEAFPDD